MEGSDLLVNNAKKKTILVNWKMVILMIEETKRTDTTKETLEIQTGDKLVELYLKSDVFILANVFEKLNKVSNVEFVINPSYCVSLPGYFWNCNIKRKSLKLRTLQDKDTNKRNENKFAAGISSVLGDRYEKLKENKKIFYVDAKNLYG